MCRRTSASATKVTHSAAAISAKYDAGRGTERPRSGVTAQDRARPANRHGHADAGRPHRARVTCAASAYIVVCAALIIPPVNVSIDRTARRGCAR